ncbi:MAG TPA: nuclear transport factor 2 family protein [Solirubrobacteraceae bacterium]|jgi:ketosteroid isomerase-like protein|nr:nuclear transport factor 2 family protein [Solirubrobacteraceae bacterium]
MSQENVELARRAFEAFANGGADALVEYATPDCVFYPDPGWMEENEYRGRDAFIAFNKTQSDAFGNFTVEVHDIRAVGDRVLVLAEFIGRAEGSGVPIRQKAAHVLSGFRDGMIGEDRTFLSWDAGLKAVGLEE